MMDWDSDPELKKIRKEFIDSFKERREIIAGILKDMKKGAPRNFEDAFGAKNLEKLLFVAHKIAGTAESYDFPTLTRIGVGIETIIRGETDEGAPASGSVSPRELAKYCLLLTRALKSAMSGKDPVDTHKEADYEELISVSGQSS